MTRGMRPSPFTQRYRFICTPGSSPSHADRMHAVFVGVNLQDGTDGRIDFGVHQHDVFSVLECVENDSGAELDRARDIHQNIDLRSAPAERRLR